MQPDRQHRRSTAPQYQQRFQHPTDMPQPGMYGQMMPAEPDAQEEEPRERRPRRPRRRFSLIRTVLTVIGAITVFVIAMRFAIVPLLVFLGGVFGGK